MSPSGKAMADSGARGGSPLASAHLSDESKADATSLPLRLSVAQGGLGLELCEPVKVGPLVVEELEVALPGLNYPLDLSKGVKQFRNRRSVLRHAAVRLDLGQLARAWAEGLSGVWGPGVRVRLRPVVETDGQRNRESGVNDGGGVPSLSVSIYSDDTALSFDLVITSGTSPRVAIDAPRLFGRPESSLLLAMRSIDAGLSAASAQRLSLARSGRAIEMSGLSEALALLVLPRLGCRLPRVEDQVVQSVTFEKGSFRVVLGARQEPFASGRRALRVATTAEFLATADAAVSDGDLALAREYYLTALEQAPGHPDALQELADLDLAVGERAESALSFLQELDEPGNQKRSAEANARFALSLAVALEKTGRSQLVAETLERHLSSESDPVLAALSGVALAELESSPTKKRERLDHAVARAPFLMKPRLARFHLALRSGDVRMALSDAEQLEAAHSAVSKRAEICTLVGRAFIDAGRNDEGRRWLRRGLRLRPDDPEAMVALAECLSEAGETLRAAELLQTAIRRLVATLDSATDPKVSAGADLVTHAEETEKLAEQLSKARFHLAQLLLEDGHEAHQALSQLSSVDMRSSVGADARLMEAELQHEQGNSARRDRALLRLLEAMEMRWVSVESYRERVRAALAKFADNADPSLIEFSEVVLGSAKGS